MQLPMPQLDMSPVETELQPILDSVNLIRLGRLQPLESHPMINFSGSGVIVRNVKYHVFVSFQ